MRSSACSPASRNCPPDSKLGHLRSALGELRTDGFGQVMVFTQYTDTMDFLRRELGRDKEWRLMCFLGARRRDTVRRRLMANDRP